MANRTSASQFEIMMDFLEKNPQMLSGKVDPTFSKETKDKRWEELASALNAEGNGPAKSIANWRKTLKDWKCYVKKKAGKIALQHKQTGGGPPSKEKLTVTEEKLLAAIGEVAAHGQKCVEESPICGDFDLDESIDKDVMDPQDDIQNYCGNRKAVKRRIKNSLAAEVSQKLIRSQNETNENQRRMAEAAERKILLLEQQVSILKSRVATKEKLALMEEKKLHMRYRSNMQKLRMHKLNFL